MIKTSNSGRRRSIFASLLVSALLSAAAYTPVSAAEFMTLYSMKDRNIWKSVKSALSGHTVHEYKVDLLAVADYSAKQKIVAKADQYDYALVVGPRASTILHDAQFKTVVVSVEAKTSLSGSKVLYVVTAGTPDSGAATVSVSDVSGLTAADLSKATQITVTDSGQLGTVVASVIERLGK